MKLYPPDKAVLEMQVEGGHIYRQNKGGFDVENKATAKLMLKAGCFTQATGAKVKYFWRCECGWEAYINSCPRCHRTDLSRATTGE